MEVETNVRKSLVTTSAASVPNEDAAVTAIDSLQPSWQQSLRAQHSLLSMPLFGHLVDDVIRALIQAPTPMVTFVWEVWQQARQMGHADEWLQAWLALYPCAGSGLVLCMI
jgi:hypothetical protein